MSTTPSHEPDQQGVRLGNAVVFWLLTSMALGMLAVCVLLPEWRVYQQLDRSRQVEQGRVDEMQAVVDKERRRLRAIQSDPEVMARLAQRELGFRRAEERDVTVRAEQEAGEVAKNHVPTSAELPASLARAASYLPDFDFDVVFCDEGTRRTVMGMCVALLCVAVWISPKRLRAR